MIKSWDSFFVEKTMELLENESSPINTPCACGVHTSGMQTNDTIFRKERDPLCTLQAHDVSFIL